MENNNSCGEHNNGNLVNQLYRKIKHLEEENKRLLEELQKNQLKSPKQHQNQKQPKEKPTTSKSSGNIDQQKPSLNAEDEIQSSSLDSFVTYKKRKGTSDCGKEFEYMMCALFAIKLSVNDNITNFEMTTNNEIYGDFDDISLEIVFEDGTKNTFLLQLKHKESKKNITNSDLVSPKNDFGLLKYMKSFEEIKIEDTICILYTNNATSIVDASTFTISIKPEKEKKCQQDQEEFEIKVKKAYLSDHMQLMMNKDLDQGTTSVNSEIFQFEISGDTSKYKKKDKFSTQFYLFTNQNNLHTVKSSVQHMLNKLLQQDIYDLFVHYMKEWWSGRFVLTKRDVIAKLVELALSPWIRTINRSKISKKSKLITKTIMNFEITIVKDSKTEVENIWKGTSEHHHRFGKAAQKFFCTSANLSHQQKSKILWHMDEVPLIVTTNEKNKIYIKRGLHLLQKVRSKKKFLLIGQVGKDEFFGWDVFENLYDLHQRDENIYKKIVKIFNISLQRRSKISLQDFVSCGREAMECFKVGELLKMSQNSFLPVGVKEKVSVKSYIPRTISTIFLDLKKMSQNLTYLKNFIIIINCQEHEKNIFQNTNLQKMELSSFLKEHNKNHRHLLLFSSEKKCTRNDFDAVCQINKELHVYLLQVFNENCCTLLLKKGNNLPIEEIKYELQIEEAKIFENFNNHLNVFCAPPGMGKSTLFSTLSRNCPSQFWCLHIKLIDHNFFLKTKPNNEQLLQHFIENNSGNLLLRIKKILLKSKRMYILLDGLDEVDSEYTDRVLDFVKYLSAEGNFVWISLRENLREKISQSLNLVSIDIQELTNHEQKIYTEKRLRKEYENYEIEQIVDVIFASTDVVSSQQLLGIPLQLFMITENFINDRNAYLNLNEKKMFVLTTMYKMFFEGKKKFLYQKTGIEQQAKQIGYSFNLHLKQYEIPALKSCLDFIVFEKLKITEDDSSEFLEGINEEGDKFGIITHVNQTQAIFSHQTYAEYFACVWLAKHLNRVRLIQKEIFSDQYQNLKLIFDIMMAEERPLHLAVIYKSDTQFEKYLNKIHEKDRGGRTALHLACSYGMKYSLTPTRVERESTLYVKIVEKLIQEDTVCENDDLFDFDYLQYSLESLCLYPIEMMLERKMVIFGGIDMIWNYYDHDTVAYYAAQLGYPNLLSYVIKNNPGLVDKEVGEEYLLHLAVIGSKNETYATMRTGNIAATEILIKNGANINKPLEENFFRRESLSILDYVCQHGCHDMFKILLQNGAKCTKENTILHQIAQYQTVDDEVIGVLENFNVNLNAQNSNGITALQLVCENGHVESVKKLLEKKVDVNVRDNNGNNVLHFACQAEKENTEIISLLVDGGVAVNGQNDNGTTPLHFASLCGQVKTVKLLLEKGALPNILDNNNKSPLHYACQTRKENVEVVNELMKYGFDHRSLTAALQLACRNSHTKIVEKILEEITKFSIVDDQYKNLLHFACQSKTENTEIIDLLLNHGFSVNAQNKIGITALHLACKHGHIEILKKLVDKGADVNMVDHNGRNALHYAYQSLKQNTEVILFLLTCDIDVNAQDKSGTTGLHLACLNSQADVAKKLLEKHSNPNIEDCSNKTALHFACQSFNENPELVNLLLNYGIDVNARNKSGATALHLACFNGQFKIANNLIAKKSVVNVADNDSKTPLHYACQSLKENTELIQLLIDGGINVNARSQHGTTALHVSCENGHFKIAKELIELGADVNILDCNEKNALHYACQSRRKNTEIIRLLITHGLDVNRQNKFGTTPLQLACQSNQGDNIKFLIDVGANVDLVDNDNKDALYYLRQSSKNSELINLLVKQKIDSCEECR